MRIPCACIRLSRRTLLHRFVSLGGILLPACGQELTGAIPSEGIIVAPRVSTATATLGPAPSPPFPPPTINPPPTANPTLGSPFPATPPPTPPPPPTYPLPTPRTPAAMTLSATPDTGTAPLMVTFQVTIPAGIGTGCEASVYASGDGPTTEGYLPCGYVVPSIAPGVLVPSFVPPTPPPRSQTMTFKFAHTYTRPGTYTAQYGLRDRDRDRGTTPFSTTAVTITHVSNTVTITVR